MRARDPGYHEVQTIPVGTGQTLLIRSLLPPKIVPPTRPVNASLYTLHPDGQTTAFVPTLIASDLDLVLSQHAEAERLLRALNEATTGYPTGRFYQIAVVNP